MSRKKIGSPRKKMRMLHVATLLPVDPQALYTHCSASWTGIKARFTTLPANTVDADLLALSTALGNGPGGSPADTAVIVVAAAKVRQDWKQVAAYVEGALLAGPIEAAPAILAEILMYESKVGLRAPKPELQAKQRKGTLSGVVLLIALAVPSAVLYVWELSVDGVSWQAGGQCAQANCTIAGLTPGKMYYFRFHTITRAGTLSALSQVVSYMPR